MKDERRINIRVDPASFKKLKGKLAEEDTSFQRILGDFLEKWLSGKLDARQGTGTTTANHPPEQGTFLIAMPAGLSDDMTSRLRTSISNVVRLFAFAEDGDEFLELAEQVAETCANSAERRSKRGSSSGQIVVASGRHHKGGTGRTTKTRKVVLQDKEAV